MTQTIKILDPHEAIKIAAGEVIERPANIIKELLENSIDAQAKNITLHLYAAGKDLIKITDDGCGMSPDDAKLCFAHHATSKINSVNDLTSIVTYGFRGEALSSIAAVSHVELISKTESEKLATHIKIAHGTLIDQTTRSHQTGSTFIISQLFDNIPARKKFLKTDDTEWNLIVTIFQAFALRYPQINFKMFHNDHLAYNCPATLQIKTRCAQLWTNQLHEQLLELTPTIQNDINISGAISSIHYHRFNRGQIFTFVNNRWVKNQELFKGILKGYDGVLPNQKFPAAFIFIQINPQEVDINIHPKKEEVKFLHPTIVQRTIEMAVKDCLKADVTLVLNNSLKDLDSSLEPSPRLWPTGKADIPVVADNPDRENNIANKTINPSAYASNYNQQANLSVSQSLDQNFQKKFKSFNVIPNFKRESQSLSLPSDHPSPITTTNTTIHDHEPYNIVGQFKKTYIMVEKSDQLIIIDQHGAHERILYERFKAKVGDIAMVQLLFPHIIKLNSEEIGLVQHYQKILHYHGILFDQFSDHEIIIQATPVQMSAQSAQEIIKTVLEWLEQHQNIEPDQVTARLHEKIMAEKACKAACKAGDTLSIEQIQNLLHELRTTENNFCCPHGRPTLWNVALKDIEKHFKRDYQGAKDVLF